MCQFDVTIRNYQHKTHLVICSTVNSVSNIGFIIVYGHKQWRQYCTLHRYWKYHNLYEILRQRPQSGKSSTDWLIACSSPPSFTKAGLRALTLSKLTLAYSSSSVITSSPEKESHHEVASCDYKTIIAHSLTHWDLVMPYGDIDLGNHWFR